MTWLDELVNQYDELESPRNFWWWSGLCTISAVVKDNISLDCGGAYPLYPNIYVMLHADSGLKKGPPIGLAKNLVKRVNNTRIITGRSSIQGILKELGTAYTVPGGRTITKSVGFIVASEFSSSLVADPAALVILTDLYDRQYNPGKWVSLLKMESFELKDPTISLLCATNQAHFDDFIEAKDIAGGFIGRTFMIAESKVHRLNPLIVPLEHTPDPEQLAEYLKEIAAITGQFEVMGSLTEDAAHPIMRMVENKHGNLVPNWFNEPGWLYHDWYMDYYSEVIKQKIEDPTGTIQRVGDSIKKVAMLLSLSESTELVITYSNMQEAIDRCMTLIGNVRRTTDKKKGMSQHSDQKSLILKELMKRIPHRMTRTMMLQKFYHHLDAIVLDEIMVSFDDANMITIVKEGSQIVYEIPNVQVKKMEAFMAGKNLKEE